jgi:hypothetical protein
VHRFRRSLRTVLVATAGVATALGVASLTQAASGEDAATSTTKTSTTKTSTTKTTTTPKPKAAPKAVKKTISCKAKLYATRTPVSNAEEFGTLSCASPLGKGVQHNTAKVTRNADATKGTFSGTVKLFLNTGTVRGSYKTEFTVQTGAAKYDGTMKISSGTGEFKGVTGTGTITGSSANGITSSLTEKLTLTFAAAAE